MEAGGLTHILTQTHPHFRTQTCVSLPLSLCRLATKSSATESVGAENHYGNQHSGPGCGCSWIGAKSLSGIHSEPESIIESLLLSVLPGLADYLVCAGCFL